MFPVIAGKQTRWQKRGICFLADQPPVSPPPAFPRGRLRGLWCIPRRAGACAGFVPAFGVLEAAEAARGWGEMAAG